MWILICTPFVCSSAKNAECSNEKSKCPRIGYSSVYAHKIYIHIRQVYVSSLLVLQIDWPTEFSSRVCLNLKSQATDNLSTADWRICVDLLISKVFAYRYVFVQISFMCMLSSFDLMTPFAVNRFNGLFTLMLDLTIFKCIYAFFLLLVQV